MRGFTSPSPPTHTHLCGVGFRRIYKFAIYYVTNKLTNKLTDSRDHTVLLEKLTRFHLLKKYSAFYGNRKFTTAFTKAPPVPILNQINPFHGPRKIQFNIMLPSTPRSSKMSLPSCFPTKTLYALLSPIHATCSAHLIFLHLVTE